jgi:inosine-uridine nucleoside N-ribohydrolase
VQQDNETGFLFDWAASTNLDAYPGVVYADGIAAMHDTIVATPGITTIIAIAPAGNIQALLARYPGVEARVRIVAMSGSIYRGYDNSTKPDAEYNVADNVPASQAMYAAHWAETMVTTPLDTCGVAVLAGTDYRSLLQGSGPILTTLLECWLFWCNSQNPSAQQPSQHSSILYDPVAVYLASGWSESFTDMVALNVSVTDAGYTVPSVQVSVKLRETERGRERSKDTETGKERPRGKGRESERERERRSCGEESLASSAHVSTTGKYDPRGAELD